MAAGGKRSGAGRKANTPNKATKERQERVAATGATPLDVMIEAMRFHHAVAEAALCLPKPDLAAAKLAYEAAGAFAKDAAPYVHPRLQAVQHSGPNGGAIQIAVSGAKDKLAHFVARQSAARSAA